MDSVVNLSVTINNSSSFSPAKWIQYSSSPTKSEWSAPCFCWRIVKNESYWLPMGGWEANVLAVAFKSSISVIEIDLDYHSATERTLCNVLSKSNFSICTEYSSCILLHIDRMQEKDKFKQERQS